MNHVEIKNIAREKISGNKWKILKPLLISGFVFGILNSILTGIFHVDLTNITASRPFTYEILSAIISFLESFFAICYIKYILNFIRTGAASFSDIFDCMKHQGFNAYIASIIAGLLSSLGLVFLLVPGIIIALMYTFAVPLVFDDNLGCIEALKASKNLMNGHKMDYFKFLLSFIGWVLLGIITCGIGFIYVYPYMIVSQYTYYDKLRELK